jgi:hypothetical protein
MFTYEELYPKGLYIWTPRHSDTINPPDQPDNHHHPPGEAKGEYAEK